MSADQVIAALHAVDDELRPVVEGLTDDQLDGPSGASEWPVHQVLSHLGSGAVITQGRLVRALEGVEPPSNQDVWDRWNALGAQEHRSEYLTANAALLARYDALDGATRESLMIDLGFLPAPVPLAVAGRFRLNEFALHSWDVRVALDPSAVVHPDAVAPLVDQLGMTFGWLAKGAAALTSRVEAAVTLTDTGRTLGLSLGEGPSLGEAPTSPDATLELTSEQFLRLATGRLRAPYTPSSLTASGALTVDQWLEIFPGF